MKIEGLSKRERDVLAQIGQAKTAKEIARALSISPRTVEIHVGMIKRKTGCRNKMAMALLAHGIRV